MNPLCPYIYICIYTCIYSTPLVLIRLQHDTDPSCLPVCWYVGTFDSLLVSYFLKL